MPSQACARRVLSTGDCSMVEQCSCGMVHVTIGGVTLRLAPQVLTQLATVMNEAARMMVLRDAFSPTMRDEVLS